jgi:hypothetical protein
MFPENVLIERMAFMKTLLTLGFLLAATLLLPGCYTILLMEDSDESTSIEYAPISQPIEYIPIYDPGPICPILLPVPHPPPPPQPVNIVDNPPSTPTSSDIHREIHTGRDTPISNPAAARNDDNNRSNRGSEANRGGR